MSNKTPTREQIVAALNSGVFGDGDNYDLEVCAGSIESLFAPYMAELQELRQRVAEVRRTTLLEAAKSVCKWCNDERIGYKNLMWVPGDCKYCHGWSGPFCLASAIHALLSQGQAQGVSK